MAKEKKDFDNLIHHLQGWTAISNLFIHFIVMNQVEPEKKGSKSKIKTLINADCKAFEYQKTKSTEESQ